MPAVRSLRIDRFEYEDGDLARRLGLVRGIGRPGLDGARPPGGLLVAGHLPGEVVADRRPILEFDVRVGLEVVVPDRMSWGATERGNDGVDAVMLHSHQGRLA